MNLQAQLPKVVSGKIVRIDNFKSAYITARNIDIWLPENYDEHKKYAVLYMHDGQMLYDPEASWNRQAWNMDDAATELLRTNRIKQFIVVGIWNSGETRHADYFPQKPFEQLSQNKKDSLSARLQNTGRSKKMFQPRSDDYLKFIVQELKPYIDHHFAVYKNRKNTFIAGSSMGGLISIYAICEYPKVFGGAACLSTHWPGTFTLENNPVPDAFIDYLKQNLPKPRRHKIYFDCGDKTLDALYPDIQKRVDSVMISKGFDDRSWITKYFPGDEHNENSWSKRLHFPLEFLLGIAGNKP